LSRDMGDYRIILDNEKNEVDKIVFWFDKRFEIELSPNVKVYMDASKLYIGISSEKTFSFGSKDKSIYFQFYNRKT
jgi:hypothetical protein